MARTVTRTIGIELPQERLANFCRRWQIAELSLFGSVLREDFRPDSDVDVLVSFDPSSSWRLFDQVSMQEELSQLLGRKVDLVSRRAIEASSNWIRRQAILDCLEIVYVGMAELGFGPSIADKKYPPPDWMVKGSQKQRAFFTNAA